MECTYYGIVEHQLTSLLLKPIPRIKHSRFAHASKFRLEVPWRSIWQSILYFLKTCVWCTTLHMLILYGGGQ